MEKIKKRLPKQKQTKCLTKVTTLTLKKKDGEGSCVEGGRMCGELPAWKNSTREDCGRETALLLVNCCLICNYGLKKFSCLTIVIPTYFFPLKKNVLPLLWPLKREMGDVRRCNP